ncbi:hypothetical protein, partial [Streptomyces sp. NPDC059881]|uniref:hypothetical protein n=1 Tax=Streptomyces sp. NPDC059881 TaxID=3346986 RepID=UPI0036472FF9
MARQREALDLAALGSDSSDFGRNRQNFGWLLREHGPLKVRDAVRVMVLTVDYFRTASAAGTGTCAVRRREPAHNGAARRVLRG